jgi:hypothetical protein
MKRRTTRALAAGLLVASAALFAVRAHGEDAAPEGGRTLAPGDVEAFLVEAGHPSKEAGTLRRVEILQDGVTYYCDVAVGPNGRYLWLSVPLSALPPAPVSRRGLIGLLSANAGEAGLHFLLSGDRIVLARPVDNRELTASGLSHEIRRFVEGVRTTRDVWDVSRWSKEEVK